MSNEPKETVEAAPEEQTSASAESETGDPAKKKFPLKEIGGPTGPEPTRYGDWEKKGRCIDF